MKLLTIACMLLTGCAVAIPATVATSYVAGQVAAAYMPDSIVKGERKP